MTADPKDAEIARYHQTGYDRGIEPAHEGGWVRYTDHAAEITRLRMALAESEAAAEGALMILMQTRAERDAALAQVAGAYEAAAQEADEHKHFTKGIECCGDCIRALTPADALAARDRRDAHMRAEGLREAAEIADAKDPDKPTNYLHRRENIPAAILAAAEKEAGDV